MVHLIIAVLRAHKQRHELVFDVTTSPVFRPECPFRISFALKFICSALPMLSRQINFRQLRLVINTFKVIIDT